MKVIFLDVDGVLNYADCWFRPENKNKGKFIWDDDCIKRVNRIVKETGAKIVLSSDWRLYDEYYDAVLNKMNIEGEIIDVTPSLMNLARGIEIQAWLDEHPEVTNFVILDDRDDMAHLMHKLVQTSFEIDGLTDKLAVQAIEMLNK